jgi:hypothetical protein
MASEITVRNALTIRAGSLDYRSSPSAFIADLDSAANPFGPTPGAVVADTDGRDVDLSALTTPGFVFLQNLEDPDGDNGGFYVEYGIRDGTTGYFYPFGELGAGETAVLKLSRNLLEAYTGTGTGTTGTVNFFHVRATGGSCNVRVDAFER